MTNTFVIGDRVAYSRNFLRSTGQYSGAIPFARGRVVGVKPVSKTLQVVEIDWGEPDIPERVLSANLVLVSEFPFEDR